MTRISQFFFLCAGILHSTYQTTHMPHFWLSLLIQYMQNNL